MKEALSLDEVVVVAMVERYRAPEVEWRQIVVTDAVDARTAELPRLGQQYVDVSLVVDPVPEVRASRQSNRVGPLKWRKKKKNVLNRTCSQSYLSELRKYF